MFLYRHTFITCFTDRGNSKAAHASNTGSDLDEVVTLKSRREQFGG